MSNNTELQVKRIIHLFCKTNPELHSKTEEQYFADIAISLKDVEDWMILQAIKVCEDKHFYQTKSIHYFRGIAVQKKIEHTKKRELEAKQLTPIPTKIVGRNEES